MENRHSYLFGARSIRERVVEPFVSVIWTIGRPERDMPVVYGDDLMIMIFDISDYTVHLITKEHYVRYRMMAIAIYDAAMHVELDFIGGTEASLNMPEVAKETVDGWYNLMRQHGDLVAYRLRKLLTQ